MAVCPEYNPTDDTLDVTMTFSTIANSGNVFYVTMVVTTTNGGDACMVSKPTKPSHTTTSLVRLDSLPLPKLVMRARVHGLHRRQRDWPRRLLKDVDSMHCTRAALHSPSALSPVAVTAPW
ncbi:hypothetical protein PC129_g19305 [Phytophthora cactorum]|nr:hypothetical protein PC118_g24362 [Phytophthora cactorum]KAG3209683.1 hypothetical protein PC129_g19305 [Phytophthora cactorum]